MVEIMLVIAIVGVMLGIGIPTMFRGMSKLPIQQAVRTLEEACRAARTAAILQGQPAEVVIQAQEGTVTVALVAEGGGAPSDLGPSEPGLSEPGPAGAASGRPDFSGRIPASVAFKQLRVNLRDMMDYDEARIRFYPNGTSDELTAVLLSEQNEERALTLEIVTGREHVEVIR